MPLMWLSGAFLFGIATTWWIGGSFPTWIVAGSGCSFLVLFAAHLKARNRAAAGGLMGWLSKRWPEDSEALLPGLVIPCLPLVFLLGGFRLQAATPEIDPRHLAWYNDQVGRIVVEGVIDTDPEFRDAYTLFEVESDRLHAIETGMSISVYGRLLMRTPPGRDWRYGDRIRLEGHLATPGESEEFSYRTYLEHLGIYSTMTCPKAKAAECVQLLGVGEGSRLKGAIFSVRRKALEVVHRILPDPEAALLAGILLGIETGIPEPVLEDFRQTGTAHIIAISGFNFAIISGLFVFVFGKLFGLWKSLPLALLGIAGYAVLAGASGGVVRAAIMGSLGVFALRIGRRSSGINSLIAAAGLMALFSPHVLWDVSFQLSFMATLGLILYAEPLSEGFIRLVSPWISEQGAKKLAVPVGSYLLFTLAAQVTTLPLILYYFRQASLISLVANPLVLPPQPALMVLGGIAVVLGFIRLAVGKAIAILVWPLLAYTIRIVEMLGGISKAGLKIDETSVWAVLGTYALIFGWTLGGSRLRDAIRRLNWGRTDRLGWGLCLVTGLIGLVIWQCAFTQPDGRLRLTLLDVGDGEGLLIRTQEGRKHSD